MDNKISFPETVMLIDAVELNSVIVDLKKNFEKILKRSLPDMDMAQFIVNVALDANIASDNKETQIILVYDQSTPRLQHCIPSALDTELNGVAFEDVLGEFIFSSLSPENMVSREELFLDLLNIIGESADVKKLIVVSFDDDNERFSSFYQKIKNKQMTLFSMVAPEKESEYSWQMLAYPIMQAFGIKGNEI